MARRQSSKTTPDRGQVLEGQVRALGRSGDGAVETERGIVFVPFALPQEQVRLRLSGKSRGVLRGQLIDVLRPSEDRVRPVCQLQQRCGGCPIMHLDAAAQREHRRTMVEHAVARFASADLRVAITESRSQLGYRTRARLHFKGGLLGYRAEASHVLCDVPSCPVLDACNAHGLDLARTRLLPILRGPGELQIAHGAGGKPVLWLRCKQAQAPEVYAALDSLVTEERLAGAILLTEEVPTPARFGEPRQRMDGADGLPLWGPVLGFSQSNAAVNRALCDRVLDLAEPAGKRVLELYAGHGNLTVLLARHALTLDAVEAHPGAAESCRENLKSRGLSGARVHAMAAEAYNDRKPVDLVVLDPPRTGAREVLAKLVALRPKVVVYVSCDPPTLARDLGELHQAGYEVDRAHAFDMFPQTAHVEAVVRLRRATA